MAETKKAKNDESKSFAIALGHLKEINTKNSDYMAAFAYLQDDPPFILSDSFDAMLIKAITDEFKGLNVDILLMSFGLLSGYERRSRIGKRREKFLRHSNYVEDFYQNPTGAYDEVDPEQQKLYESSLIDAEKERTQNLADFLLEKKRVGTINDYITDLKGYFNPRKKKAILPKPNYLKYSHCKKAHPPITYWEYFKMFWLTYMMVALLFFGGGWIAKDIFSSLNTGVPTPEPTNGSIENPVNTSNNGDNIIINNYGTINYSDFFDNE